MNKISGIAFLVFLMFFSLVVAFGVQEQGRAQDSDSSILAIGSLEDFPPGTIKPFLRDKIIIFSDEVGLYAISTECTHMRCNLAFKKEFNTFMCQCHGSSFNKKGEVLSGPATKSLPWYFIEIDAQGQVKIDKSKIVPAGTKYTKPKPQ
jgi:nitrite reductase/ring-hydroxylating ferredoxin subunit